MVVVEVDEEVLVVGPEAFPAEAAMAMPAAARPIPPIIITVFTSLNCALLTPAGFPGANGVCPANALETPRLRDRTVAVMIFMLVPVNTLQKPQ